MRMEGETVSSNWPDLTAHINTTKKKTATTTLMMIRIMITDILYEAFDFGHQICHGRSKDYH